ncbi:Uncharacterized protein TCAP_03288, partial [Tolypocladium capitatum]
MRLWKRPGPRSRFTFCVGRSPTAVSVRPDLHVRIHFSVNFSSILLFHSPLPFSSALPLLPFLSPFPASPAALNPSPWPIHHISTLSRLKSSFRARFSAEQGKTFSEVHDAAASDWGRHHLFACRVVRRVAQRNVLPMLSDYTLPSDARSSAEIIKFLDGPESIHMAQSEHRLVRDPGCGHSLGQVRRATSDDEGYGEDQARSKSKRARPNTQEVNDDSSMSGSSPSAKSSRGSSSVGYVDPESHRSVAHPEDETLRLASCVIRHILYFAPPQDSETEKMVVEFRDAKSRVAARTTLQRMIVATDDGGLYLRQEEMGVFKVEKPLVAIMEAKGQFHHIENGRPVISDRCFAQMTCEALVARLAPIWSSIILINAVQHYMCFLQFDISNEYLENFDSDAPTSFIYVNSTPWFDLSSKSGRSHVLSNLCGIMRW